MAWLIKGNKADGYSLEHTSLLFSYEMKRFSTKKELLKFLEENLN